MPQVLPDSYETRQENRAHAEKIDKIRSQVVESCKMLTALKRFQVVTSQLPLGNYDRENIRRLANTEVAEHIHNLISDLTAIK